jgi:hypothetical protein
MADRVDAKVLQILSRQPRHHIAIDIMVAEDRLVLLKPEPVEPCRNVHARLPAAATNRVCLPYRDRRLRARYQRGFRQSCDRAGHLPAPSGNPDARGDPIAHQESNR